MEVPAHIHGSPEKVGDDAFATLRLPPLAQTGEFWKRYDRLADVHDMKLTSNLNGNLDVLLIFAALFSAVNTAFIAITMPDLSPQPSDETNALLRLLVLKVDNNTLTTTDLSPPFSPKPTSIITNCLLYASLSCSLLAAVGAMMAKEWLQSFDRSGQTGPLEEQGKFRQCKFNGFKEWQLEAVIKFLPNLVLFAVALFLVGIGLFLYPINTAVAGTVIAFSVLGVTLSGIAISAGAIYPMCPYQSAASNALRRIFDILFRCRRILSGMIARRLDGPASLGSRNKHRATHYSDTKQDVDASEQTVTAQAACWLLRTTSNRGDQIAAAWVIRSLETKSCAPVFGSPGNWHELLSLTCEAFDGWGSEYSEENREIAEVSGRASCHVFLAVPQNVIKQEKSSSFQLPCGELFLWALELVCTKHSVQEEDDEERIFYIAFLSTLLRRTHLIQQYQWMNLSRLLLFSKHPRPPLADHLLGVWVTVASNFGRGLEIGDTVERLMELGGSEEELAKRLLATITRTTDGLNSAQGALQLEPNTAQAYFVCLRRARELVWQSPEDVLQIAARSVEDLIRNYLEPLTGSNSGQASPELVRLSVEAVLAWRDFVGAKPSPTGFDRRPEQPLDDNFVNAVADILLDDGVPTDRMMRPIKPIVIKILLWVSKTMSEILTGGQQSDQLFPSTCRLWAPLEKEVEFSKRDTQYHDKPLTPDDLQRIVEFVDSIKKDRETSAFISRNVDVEMNRLHAHFNQQLDWNYELFDFCDRCM
ncbi:hypothetical protein FRC01_005140 [Tulasnella sp. 417]|nr:hypothetical protein FRC01_005140 [Tulasnella sp. 417]